MYSKKEQWKIFITVNALVVIGALLFPLYLKVAAVLPIGECYFLRYTGFYCMGCGVTRALKALLRLDFWASLQYNPLVLVVIVLFLLYEGRMIWDLVQGKPRDLYLKGWMVAVFLSLWGAYALVRNILLFNGIDLLANVL